MATHSRTLVWQIPWTEEPGRLQSMGSLRVRHNFTFTFHFHALEKEMAAHSSVLAWRIPGTEEPSGLPSMGSHRVGHDWSDLAAAFCYQFLLVYFSCQLSCCSSLLFKSSLFGKHFWYLLDLCLRSFFWDFGFFIVITLNSFSGRLPIFSSFGCSFGL